RISTFGQQSNNMRNLNLLQQALHERSVKATRGGKISDSFADFPSSSERIINMDVERQQLQTFSISLKLAESQLLTSETNLAQLGEVLAVLFKDLISGINGDPTSAFASIGIAQQTLDDVVRIGNTNLGGKYLFGKGSNIAPINVSGMVTPNLGDPPDYSYSYVGNAPFRVKTNRQNEFFEYGVGVDTPVFENAIHGLLLMKTADPTDQTRLTEALDKISLSLKYLGNIQAQIGQQIVVVEKAMEFNVLNTEEYIAAQTKVVMMDPAQAVFEFQDAETQMKLSRQILSRLGRQSLLED
ncbi:MAG: hypothetical protein J0G29_06925, partial [Alphaproteobacteria bacterium]|nr:hypothetical protein [Alphaproteobacteria bacterium]